MPKRSSKTKKPRDVNSLAAQFGAEATPDENPQEADQPISNTTADDRRNPAAVALGRLGGLVGGNARARKLSKKRRSEIAAKAAKARWDRK